jgi:hypothetical protein
MAESLLFDQAKAQMKLHLFSIALLLIAFHKLCAEDKAPATKPTQNVLLADCISFKDKQVTVKSCMS